MTIINTTSYSSNPVAFLNKLFEIIRQFEQGTSFNGLIHNDNKGVPTLGCAAPLCCALE
jgi:hypothetical protein